MAGAPERAGADPDHTQADGAKVVFMRVFAVDWSGAKSRWSSFVAAAEIVDGQLSLLSSAETPYPPGRPAHSPRCRRDAYRT